MKKNELVWINNGFRLARGIREIRRGKNKGKLEVKYLKGSRIKKTIIQNYRQKEG